MVAQSLAFIFVMGGLAVIAVLAFVAYLLMRHRTSTEVGSDDTSVQGERVLWMEYLLAIIALLIIVIGGITLIVQSYSDAVAVQSTWRTDARSGVF